MQLKGLVKIFAVLLILICLYQLSFTWFVRSHEGSMKSRAEKWVKANNPTAEQKYPSNSQLRTLYNDTLAELQLQRLQRLLDSTKNDKIVLGVGTYQYAKEQELMLGLDLQGGMNVTMEVGLDGLIKSLGSYSKDPAFNQAIAEAGKRKANSGADFITLFSEEYKKASPTGKLATIFTQASNRRLTYESSDDEVISYIRGEAKSAVSNTFNILRTRIDKFGVAQPSINLDENASTINIELAGVTNPERVRRYLQSTANLQFFEVYNIGEIDKPFSDAEKALAAYLTGTSEADTTTNKDTTGVAALPANVDTTQTTGLSGLDTTKGTKTASTTDQKSQFPLQSIISIQQPQQGKDGKPQFPASIGYVATKDTGVLNTYLRMDLVKNKFPSNLVFMFGKQENKDAKATDFLPLYAIKTVDGATLAKLEGDHVSDARQDFDERGRVAIKMTMDNVGEKIWAKMTGDNIGKPIAIVLDDIVYSAPFVNGVIPNGSSEITGSFSALEAKDLADILKSGKLPAPAKIVQEQVIGPTLGKDAVNGGFISFVIAFVVIFILMLVYYNTSGWITNIALILNLIFTIGILASLGATLTAPGIAGLILTIGLAVDTNVITKERIKEELTRGKAYLPAVNEAFRRSLPPILDGHITILLTAMILYYFGLGPVKGFATTQMLGIILSLFTGILITRLLTDIFNKRKIHLEYFTPLSRRIFQKAKFNFIAFRKKTLMISLVILVLGISSFFNGFDYGVEFNGGRSYTIRFDKNVGNDIEAIRTDLQGSFEGEHPVIKTVGNLNTLNITTSYLIKQTSPQTDSIVQMKLFEGLKKYLPANLSFSQFEAAHKLGSNKVLPTISDDLKRGAVKATLFAILIIFLYIFIRFRDWRYSLGTIIALLHDVLVTLIVFSFARAIVPFPLEIDQHFIAAILTVIGFSMNEAVIIFDRIREDRKLNPSAPLPDTINRAINETLSRTIMTSLTVFLTILIIFIAGGEVTRGFAFAMLVGVLTGVYSSMFVAAPMLLNLGRKSAVIDPKSSKLATAVSIK